MIWAVTHSTWLRASRSPFVVRRKASFAAWMEEVSASWNSVTKRV